MDRDQFGRTPVEQARDGLLSWISLEEMHGHMAPEIGAKAREFVDTLYRAATDGTSPSDGGVA